ncbi:MAG: DNA topoisomerase IV subunit A, partial [Kiloniellales bacterium]
REPVVLPADFPNLLANGAQGIAVGMATAIPPHNAGELCDALLHLIKHPRVTVQKLVEYVPGPDFPTGGLLVEEPDAVIEAYRTGRGSFRLRARWDTEKLKGGGYQIVVTEIPFQVQKSRLVERIAELLSARKLAMLADVRDESAADLRLVLEPKSRNVDADVLMESLFRQTDLEVRVPLNMNVLDAERTPQVMPLAEVLRAFLDHRHEVLARRSRHRLDQIERRLEVLGGYLIAYLNLDEVIRIVREDDDPKASLMAAFDLADVQAEAVLNMRLRALRKLEEEGIRREHAALAEEQTELDDLMADEARRWRVVASQIKDIKTRFGPGTALGQRRTELGTPPPDVIVPIEAVIEREPVTVLCSAKGWIRTLKGHPEDLDSAIAAAKHKEGDRSRFAVPAWTTDKLLVFATNGRFYTIGVDKLPGGRGYGEPLRLLIDLPNDEDMVTLRVHRPGDRLLVASSDGRGFVVAENDVVAQTKGGKQVLNLADGAEAAVCTAVAGDSVAVIGENRKLLIFPFADLPEMGRGRGVILQRYREGGLSDVKTFALAEGLNWAAGAGRVRTETDLTAWIGNRAAAGRLPPHGFPKSNRFG